MKEIQIDTARCTGCGLCTEICPHRVLVIRERKVVSMGEGCFLCGHCQAVCPENAVSLPGLPVDLDLQVIEESLQTIPAGHKEIPGLVALMHRRRSCRSYRDTPVPIALLEDLVKIATMAPSGTNSQLWKFTVLPTREDLLALGRGVADYYRRLNKLAENPFVRFMARMFDGDSLGSYYRNYYNSVAEALMDWDEEGRDRLFHGATAAILVGGEKRASCPAEDALLATQNILLAGQAVGLGSCLIGFAVEAIRREQKLQELLEMVEGEEIYSVIVLGYPAVHFLRPANRQRVVPRILRLEKDNPLLP